MKILNTEEFMAPFVVFCLISPSHSFVSVLRSEVFVFWIVSHVLKENHSMKWVKKNSPLGIPLFLIQRMIALLPPKMLVHNPSGPSSAFILSVSMRCLLKLEPKLISYMLNVTTGKHEFLLEYLSNMKPLSENIERS